LARTAIGLEGQFPFGESFIIGRIALEFEAETSLNPSG
jgi:hypothetical protein